jgi:hypothetical protein
MREVEGGRERESEERENRIKIMRGMMDRGRDGLGGKGGREITRRQKQRKDNIVALRRGRYKGS